MARYSIRTEIDRPYDQALAATKAALGSEGFGVLTEIDVRATMKKKLDKDFRPYVILGACNPPSAYRALGEELEVGLFLPCNVIVYETTPGHAAVAAIDPEIVMEPIENPNLRPLAREIGARLRRVIEAVRATANEPAGA